MFRCQGLSVIQFWVVQRGGRGTHAQSNTHVATFLYCWPVEPQLTKGMHHSPHLVLFRMPMVCRIVYVLFSRRLAMSVLHLHSFHITAFLTSLLLVLAGGTTACHVCFRPLACQSWVGSWMFLPSRRPEMPVLRSCFFQIAAFLTSLLLVLAGGTAACHVCFRPARGLHCVWLLMDA